ncbi:uncharacterized protein [Dermacentor andersoni]|uniref:uncharacterized protein n=1 Tax=Dermacentor andersoni TaxID=34620 RepID=UPI003B3A4CEC
MTSSEPTTGSSSPTLSPPSTTASSMTLPPSSQTSSPYSAPTSSVPSTSSQASMQASTQGPSSAPAENDETGSPASVLMSTTVPTQIGTNASITISTIISTSTSPILSSTSNEITSMQPTEAGSPFTVTRSPRTEVNSDSSNTTTTERLSTTQRTILTSLTIADVNATSDATTQIGTSVTQASTSRISASITTVSPYNLTTTTGETTEPQNSNTPIRVTTIFPTSNIPTGSTVSVPSDSSSINGTSPTEGQTISRATTASNSSPGTSSDGTSFWPSLPSPSNTFNPETSSTVSDQSSANNSTPVTTATYRSTHMTSFMTVSSVTSTASLSTSASTMQSSNETPERTPTVSTAVTSAIPTTGSLASCVNITLPNLFGLDTCLGRTLDACTTDNDVYKIAGSVVTCTIRVLSTSLSLQCVLASAKEIIVAAFSRFSSEGDDSLASVLSPFKCNNMALDGLSCSGNLRLTFPRRFAKCMNGSTEVCRGQEPIQEHLVSSLLNQVKCILVTIVGDAPSSVLSEILCEVSSVLAEKVRQLPYFGFLRSLLKPVLKLLRRIVGCE